MSPLGQTLVKEMNRLGLLVDLAHVSKDTMVDVLGGRPKKWTGSIAPVIFSHSSAYALCPHPRNVQDDVLQLVKVGVPKNIPGSTKFLLSSTIRTEEDSNFKPFLQTNGLTEISNRKRNLS